MKAILWCIANWDSILLWSQAIIGAASTIAATLAGVASKLGKPEAEGKIKAVAGAIDKVAKNPLLNRVALNPRPKSAAFQIVGPAAE